MRNTGKLVYELLALLCLALSVVLLVMVRVRLTPADEPPETPPVETTPAVTPCAHGVFEDGVCASCGYVCPHDWDEGECTLCGYACPHERHDEQSGLCALCRSTVPHLLRAGRCVRCAWIPDFTFERLPESMTQPCPEPGRVESVDLGAYSPREDGKTPVMPAQVYLPYGYDGADESTRYNLVIALHGAYSDEHSMMEEKHLVKRVGEIRFLDVYDNIIYTRRAEPFIVLSLNTYSLAGEEFWTEKGCERLGEELRERVLPYAVEHYRTYAADASLAGISAARGHIAVVGLSNGALYALRAAMADNLALFGGFACFSANYPETTESVLQTLGDPATEGYPIHCFFTGAGTKDFQQRNTEERFYEILSRTDRLSEGVNAFHTDIEGSHDWLTWGAELYNCLPLLFQETD